VPVPDSPLEKQECPTLGADVPEVLIYTDGGCSPNPGAGGWAAILVAGDERLEIAGADPSSTNNRMEITAALRGLQQLTKPSRVLIVTDSRYVFQGMSAWIERWSKNGFRKKGAPILNADLWQELARAALEHDTSWAWTRGHDGDPLNERCDELVSGMRGRRPAGDDDVLHHERGPQEGATPRVRGERTTAIWLTP